MPKEDADPLKASASEPPAMGPGRASGLIADLRSGTANGGWRAGHSVNETNRPEGDTYAGC